MFRAAEKRGKESGRDGFFRYRMVRKVYMYFGAACISRRRSTNEDAAKRLRNQ